MILPENYRGPGTVRYMLAGFGLCAALCAAIRPFCWLLYAGGRWLEAHYGL